MCERVEIKETRECPGLHLSRMSICVAVEEHVPKFVRSVHWKLGTILVTRGAKMN